MKKSLILTIVVLVLTFSKTLVTSVNAQTVRIGIQMTRDTVLTPFTGIDKAYSFKVSGSIVLNSDTSLVRVILEDIYYNVYLVYETYSLIASNDSVVIINGCDETCFMEGTSPLNLRIEIIDALINFDSIVLGSEPYNNYLQMQKQSQFYTDSIKISNLNNNISHFNMYWRAGQTSITRFSYEKKEDLFGRKFNLLGFDYYKGGVYESIRNLNNTKEVSQYISYFDWRNRSNTGIFK